MSWHKITMKFPGTCIVCNQPIAANETGYWSKGEGVKHEKCIQTATIPCATCGAPAGCETCEFADDCNLEKVSPMCICRGCADAKSPFASYRKSVQKKFPGLGI